MDVALLKSRLAHRGGLEKYTSRLAEAFRDHNCSVTLLTTGEPPPIDGIEMVSLGSSSKFSLHHIQKFDRACQQWLQKNPKPIVFGMERTTQQTHYRAGSGVHAVYLERRALSDPYFKRLSLHLNPLHRLLLKKEREAFESEELKCLFTNSYMVKQEILSRFSTPKEKIVTVHNGVEWEELSAPFEATFQEPRKTESVHLLFVGNDYHRKGLSFLLKGLALLDTPWELTVVGKEKNQTHFEKLAHQLGLAERITFAGQQSSLIYYYQKADALVIPSIYDPFSNVTLEALAMGLYVVSSPYNGGKEILTTETGSIIEELTSPDSVALSLKTALERPKTADSAKRIRESIKALDFSNQLDKIVERCIS